MKENKIVLVSASLSLTQAVIQSIIVSAIRNATFERSKKKDTPFMVYIDEFSTFANSGNDINHLLNMARKYNVSLNLAIQYLDQLGGSQKAVFGNVDTVFVLKSNALDENIINRIIKTDIKLSKFEAFVRIGGQDTVKIKMKPLSEPIRGIQQTDKIFDDTEKIPIKKEEKSLENKVQKINKESLI